MKINLISPTSFIQNYGVASSTISNPDSENVKMRTNDDIMKTLLAHEKKSSGPQVVGVPVSDEESSTSESEDEKGAPNDPTSFLTGYQGKWELIIYTSAGNHPQFLIVD